MKKLSRRIAMDNHYSSCVEKMHRTPQRVFAGIWRSKKWSKCILWTCMLLLLCIVLDMLYKSNQMPKELAEQLLKKQTGALRHQYFSVRMDKWIIISVSADSPSKTLKELTELEEWQVLIIAENGNVRAEDWGLPRASFLSIEDQETLGFDMLSYVPKTGPARKMLGYQIAIKGGAEIIYEINPEIMMKNATLGMSKHFNLNPGACMYLSPEDLKPGTIYNTFAHFGQFSAKPLGFPKQNLHNKVPNTYTTCHLPHPPLIQYGHVDGPQFHAESVLNTKQQREELYFDLTAPPIVLTGKAMTPYNSDNTLHRLEAFWALSLFPDLPFHVGDIYRSYIAQRMLWLTGQTVAFYPPNGNILKTDFFDKRKIVEEEKMYYKNMNDFINALQLWECSFKDFETCIIDLYGYIKGLGFISSNDYNLLTTWMTTLQSWGYHFPVVDSQFNQCSNVVRHSIPLSVTFVPFSVNSSQTSSKSQDENNNMCKMTWSRLDFNQKKKALQDSNSSSLYKEVNTTLLVIFIHKVDAIPLFEAWYKPTFPHRIYCGPDFSQLDKLLKWKVSYIQLENHNIVSCMLHVLDSFHNPSGFLFVTDSMLLNSTNALQHKSNHFIYTKYIRVPHQKEVETCHLQEEDAAHCLDLNNKQARLINMSIPLNGIGLELKSKLRIPVCFHKIINNHMQAKYITDFLIYIPNRLRFPFSKIYHIIHQNDIRDITNVELSLLFDCLEISEDYFKYGGFESVPTKETVDYLYPLDWRKLLSGDQHVKDYFCAVG